MFDAHLLNKHVQYALPEEIDYLVETAGRCRPKSFVMLGAGPGILALAATQRYSGHPPKIVLVDNLSCDYAREHLKASGFPVATHLVTWKADSAFVGRHHWQDEVGLLIVDADHSTKAVSRDIDAWFPFVSQGGLIFFHDFLEREGGFQGSGEWYKGSVAAALLSYKHLPWELIATPGISAVYKKTGYPFIKY